MLVRIAGNPFVCLGELESLCEGWKEKQLKTA